MAADPTNGTKPIQSAKDFAETPAGRQLRWNTEIKAAQKAVEKFHERGKKILERFQDKRDSKAGSETRVNLFTSNIQTQRALMYGKVPRAEVARRYADPDDDIGRVAALILTRLLNLDIEVDSDDYADALALNLDDFQLVGLGQARVRYEARFETKPAVDAQTAPCDCTRMQGVDALPGTEPVRHSQPLPDCPTCGGTGEAELAPAVPEHEEKVEESIHIDYIHWRDFLWSPSRVWSEVRWIAYAADLSRDDFEKRFPGKLETVAHNTAKPQDDREDGLKHDPWERIRVWEIWSKDDRKVYWYAEGATEILDEKDDPLKLKAFFPVPRPLMANLTTDALMPVPDFVLAQDLYDEVDSLSTRITILERACKVVGVYDATSDGVQRMLQEGTENELIPVDGWAMFAERGGIKGQTDWLPLDQVVGALEKLREYRAELIQLLYEVTAMSDLTRGASDAQETATAQAIKAKFVSTRMEARKQEFARYATDLLKLKAEIILTLCDDAFILKGSNIEQTADAPLAPDALKLLRDQSAHFRIEVKPEGLSATNFKELQSERMEILTGVSGYLQAATPLMQANPQSTPFLLDLLKWTLAGFRGAQTMESMLDQQIAQVKQALAQPQQPGEDPQLQAQREKAQLDVGVAKEKAKVQIETLHQKNDIEKAKLQIDAKKAQQEIEQQMRQMQLDAVRDAMGLDQQQQQQMPNQPAQPHSRNPSHQEARPK